jgi:hypothetical protein
MSRTDGHVFKPRAARWLIHHLWTNMERVRERDDLDRMVKEYNATGELDNGDFPNYQHRHTALWD